jgi:hypothetical protein
MFLHSLLLLLLLLLPFVLGLWSVSYQNSFGVIYLIDSWQVSLDGVSALSQGTVNHR